MTTMIIEVYEALKEAGASEEKAKEAARAIANHESRFDRVDRELAAIRAELGMLKWMIGGIGFGVFLLVIRSFWPGA